LAFDSIRSVRIDLREVAILELIEESRFAEGGVGVVTIRSCGLPKGTYEVAMILACAGLQRFVEELFVETARTLLQPFEPDIPLLRSSFLRWGNPNFENIARLFSRLGMKLELQSTNESLTAKKIDTFVTRRNRAVHGQRYDSFEPNPNPYWASSRASPSEEDTKVGLQNMKRVFEEFADFLSAAVIAACSGKHP
jgi:hypothetical protein